MEQSAKLEAARSGSKRGTTSSESRGGLGEGSISVGDKLRKERKFKTRTISKRGCSMTITFPEIDLMPDFLKDTDKNGGDEEFLDFEANQFADDENDDENNLDDENDDDNQKSTTKSL